MIDEEDRPVLPGITPLGKVSEGTSANLASMIQSEHWEIITGRQEMFGPHKETKSIFLRSVPDPTAKSDKDMFFAKGLLWNHPVYDHFKRDIELLLIDIEQYYTVDDWAASFILLPAGKSVARHRDVYPGPSNLHRIHLPIATNPQCIFWCGAFRVNMKIDTLYEVRNLQYIHGVENKGTTDRIHLVFDIMGDLK